MNKMTPSEATRRAGPKDAASAREAPKFGGWDLALT